MTVEIRIYYESATAFVNELRSVESGCNASPFSYNGE